ncbi:MAG: eukaryotic-like serine/threonine-protein kinase [Chloroflexota bacterium]|nr:eukaryotic-like serine/threonine-protein kinase [Chloroflexota bacterium]
MAVVYLAHDELLDRDVAIKVLRPGFAEDPAFVDRFRREARHAASLHHPNIVTTHDTGVDPETGSDFIVMQLVDGPDLKEIIGRSGPLAVGFAVRVGIETAGALAFAHDHGIVHRDIKPANILIDADGEVRVADFGIARAATDTGATTGGMIGSAQYASPEQVLGEEVGPRSDLYSLGVVLYEALTGVRPFDGPSMAAVALERLRIKPRPMTSIDPTIPRSLERIVMRLLERRPDLRYATGGAVAAELDGFRIRELGGVRRPGSRAREGVRMAAVASAPRPLPSRVADEGQTTAAPERHRRKTVAMPAGVVAAAAAIALLVAGTVGAIVLLGDRGAPGGAVAGQTFQPTGTGGGMAVVPDVSPSPTPLATPGLVPTIGPSPTAVPPASVVGASPVVTARPTPRPTPRPARPVAAGPARDPVQTVDRFYRLIEIRDYAAAAGLWSPRMRREYPPSRYIVGRFNATTGFSVHRLRVTRSSVSSRSSVVSIDITEYRSSGSPRRWVGTWDLVLVNGAWLMDRPHLAAG